GDVAGVEEASTAIEEGRLAGVAIAESLGKIEALEAKAKKESIWQRLNELRAGPFGEGRKEAVENLMYGGGQWRY
ncbi:MAG: pyridine nucleotide-disulfide oxidoreductase, partial [Anaerolineaceae bacterium]|nr:pyridine nucleotide-disulfide oxidoreductase [Anaerolineaceae bacterium]